MKEQIVKVNSTEISTIFKALDVRAYELSGNESNESKLSLVRVQQFPHVYIS